MSFPAATVSRHGRVLDFDIENRPLSYMGMDYTSAEITAIAAGWTNSTRVECLLLKPPPQHETSAREMLTWFRGIYDRADIVTGHYIRRHDLPIINAACLELGLEPLGPKRTIDTKMDLVRKKDLSASQESLAAMYGLPQPKHHMSQEEWRQGNRLTPQGLAYTRKRCVSDIEQHKALLQRLLAEGALKAPKMWRP